MRSCSKLSPGYDAENELQYIEEQLASIMLIVGLPYNAFESTSIDDMINLIKSRFPWGHADGHIAWKGLLTEHQSLLCQNIRVLWHRRQLALGALS